MTAAVDLPSVAAALRDAPADANRASLAARIRAAIPFGVEVSPEAIFARADEAFRDRGSPLGPVRIGAFSVADLDRIAADWRSLDWRILPEEPRSAAENVALDEVLTERIAAGARRPTLRFWGWNEPAVVLGRCQSVVNEVDAEAAALRGMMVVRRFSGGGAMFVDPAGAITYSLILPESAVAGLTIRQSYEICDAWVVLALRRLGIDVHHVPVNDLACSLGKIGGAAQARRRGVVLHHATLAYAMDPTSMAAVLRVGREKLRDRGVPSAAKVVAPLTLQTAKPRTEIVAAMAEEFRSRYGGTADSLTDAEREETARLVREKYGTTTWTHEFA